MCEKKEKLIRKKKEKKIKKKNKRPYSDKILTLSVCFL